MQSDSTELRYRLSTILPSYLIFDCGLPVPQFCTVTLHWWIYVFLSYWSVLSDFLDIFGSIISILNWFSSIPLTNMLFSVNIESLTDSSNGHKNMMLHATPYPREKYTVTGCVFNTKVVLYVMTAVTFTTLFQFSLSFHLSSPLMLNGSALFRSFICEIISTILGYHSATHWWYSRFPKFSPSPLYYSPNMLDNTCPSTIRNLRFCN